MRAHAVALRRLPPSVDLDATAPFGTRVPVSLMSASQGTLAPIDPELARRASGLCPPSARLTPLPSFACELASRLAIPSLVLIEARGAWRFMREPLVVQAHPGRLRRVHRRARRNAERALALGPSRRDRRADPEVPVAHRRAANRRPRGRPRTARWLPRAGGGETLRSRWQLDRTGPL